MDKKHIFELIKTKQSTPTEAFSRIRYRYDHEEHKVKVSTNPYDDTMASITVANFVRKIVFPFFPIPTAHINLDDFIHDLGIHIDGPQTLDGLFTFIEFIWYAIDATPPEFLNRTIVQYGSSNIYTSIEKAISLTLTQFGHKEVKTTEGRIVVKQNYKAEQAAKSITNAEYIDLLFKYGHFSNIGNNTTKQAILKQLADYVEPILQKRNKHQDECWTKTAEVVSDLFNNFHIRHNNKEGCHKHEYVTSMDDAQLESWYDKTYNMLLQLLIEWDNREIPKEMKETRKQ